MSLRELAVANDLLDQPAALRAQIEEEGYLFFRGLLPREEVLQVRRAILECCQRADWLVAGSDPMEGRCDLTKACREGEPAYNHVYGQVLCLEVFNRLAHHFALLNVIGNVVGEPIFPHPLKIARLVFPQSPPTPAHQDFVFIQGTAQTYTAWIPLGECPIELGGLKVNPGTHRHDLYQHHLKAGPGGMGINEDELPDNWYSTNYQPGDVLIFHSYLVHQALPNVTKDRLRLSADFRYQSISQPISEISLKPHLSLLNWGEIYRSWKAADLWYYWERLNLTIVPYDQSYIHRREEEAFELARQGNPLARPVLIRIAERDPDPIRRERARQALAELDRLIGSVTAPNS